MNPNYEMKRNALVHSLERDREEFQQAMDSLKGVARQQADMIRKRIDEARQQVLQARDRVAMVRHRVTDRVNALDPRSRVVRQPWPWLGGMLAAGFVLGLMHALRRRT